MIYTKKVDTTNKSTINIERIDAQIKKWRERLLDLSKGNPLLGINRSRVSKLLTIKPETGELFSSIAIDAHSLKMPIVKRKNKRKRKDEELNQNKLLEEDEEPEYIVKPGDIEFKSEPKDLFRIMRRIYDNGRTTLEERGVTTLHLTFGLLEWDDPILGESSSPLLLVPCQLENRGSNSHMLLKMSDEELQVNPALKLYLRERHHVNLPEFIDPEFIDEPNQESLKQFLDAVQKKTSEQNWRVVDNTWLSTFSFESLVIYTDLGNMIEEAYNNKIVAAFANANKESETSEALGEDLDEMETPETVPIPVLPADASQLHALTIATAERNLVVHGPPGTGKSQTISNLIADTLGKGKKVLFVSAKMAALDVVYDRLVKLGLGRFCLEAHSTKAGKTKIIDELKKTIESPVTRTSDTFNDELEELIKIRNNLNNYVKEIHSKKDPLGKTIYNAIGLIEKYHSYRDLDFDLPWADVTRVSKEQLEKKLELLRSLESQSTVFDSRKKHPWRGFMRDSKTQLSVDILKRGLKNILEKYIEINLKLNQLADLVISQWPGFTFENLSKLGDVFSYLSQTEELPPEWRALNIQELNKAVSLLEEALNKQIKKQNLQKEYQNIAKIEPIELQKLLESLKSEFSLWTRFFKPSYWRWHSSLRTSLKPGIKITYSSLLNYSKICEDIIGIDKWLVNNNNNLHTYSTRSIEPTDLKLQIIEYKAAIKLKEAILQNIINEPKENQILDDNIRKSLFFLSQMIQDVELISIIKDIEKHWPDGFTDNKQPLFNTTIIKVITRIKEILSSFNKLHEWEVLQATISKCKDSDLGELLNSLNSVSSSNASIIFEKKFYSRWVEVIMDQNPGLKEFAGSLREEQIARFKDLQEEIGKSRLRNIQSGAADPASGVVTARSTTGNHSEIGILQKELQKKKSFKPLRKLFAEIPRVLQALKPCMLMSPLSVSTFLKPGSINFDLVVFDEASQLPTAEAIPSILRAKQVVVAGDEKQLPPTSFFKASSIFLEEEESDDYDDYEPLESLLDNCVAVRPIFEESKIVWHYRSKDERLIKFSNHYFYDNHLITFPSATTSSKGRGIHLIYTPEGTWDRGKSRTNKVEAKKVAETVIQQLDEFPDRSIGIAAMNASQKEAIEYALDDLLSAKPTLTPLFDKNKAEPFFVKSLENVQGDERDTIIISIGYAKTPEGALSFNFGPLNKEGGWRRLNVLVTRAKWQTILVTSMQSRELAGVNPGNKGAIMLKNYIEYSERDANIPAEPVTLSDYETNDFEDGVAVALKDRGYIVDEQIGSSGYRIDLAIRDTRDKDRYLLGIECDGATYHSARTARDRDIIREQVLKNQGWKIHRVWSTDWFRNREDTLNNIIKSANNALKSPSIESIQAPPLKTSQRKEQDNINNSFDSINSKELSPNKQYSSGKPYIKYEQSRKSNTKYLLNKSQQLNLANLIFKIVQIESPIYESLLINRLKEICGVMKAGSNIKSNVKNAVQLLSRGRKIYTQKGFLYANGLEADDFRLPTDEVQRSLEQISPYEIANSVLYLVEDQFGFAKEHLPKAVMGLFSLNRNWSEDTKIISTTIEKLIKDGKLRESGYTLYLE
ncbi:DUF3320 domain-containing protein [Patescibacteria group bacterium]|nr:DUF3320 domain-containing protein [Patescibacteria group bacterium]